jgi:hypothetical protein
MGHGRKADYQALGRHRPHNADDPVITELRFGRLWGKPAAPGLLDAPPEAGHDNQEALFQPCPWVASVALDPKVARSFISAAAD